MKRFLACICVLIFAFSALAEVNCLDLVLGCMISTDVQYTEIKPGEPIYEDAGYGSHTGVYLYFDSGTVLAAGEDGNGIFRQYVFSKLDRQTMAGFATEICGIWDKLEKAGGLPPLLTISVENNFYMANSRETAQSVKRAFDLSLGTGDICYITIIKDANVRKGAGLSYGKLGYVTEGMKLVSHGKVKEKGGDEWYRVEFENGYGYIIANAVQEDK